MQNTAYRKEKWLFITFGDGNEDLRKAARRITAQALANGSFTHALNFDSEMLFSLSQKLGLDFFRNASAERGFGYWRWKPVLIEAVLTQFISQGNEFDGLVYVDAGCEIPSNSFSGLTFRKVFQATLKSNVVASQTSFPESNYTKRVVFEHLDPNLAFFSGCQMQAGWIAVRKSELSISFIKEWASLSIYSDGLLFNDQVDREYSCFKAPRNDQSIFSILFKRFGFVPYDFDYYESFGSVRNAIYPIWTSRNRSGKSRMKFFVNWNITGMIALLAHTVSMRKSSRGKMQTIVGNFHAQN